jgi:hypothetical protein
MRYEEWIIHVDRVIQRITGCNMDMLPDWLSRDAFDDGLTPTEAADECLTQIGWFDEELVDEL